MPMPLIQRLERSRSLSDEERQVLADAATRIKHFGPDENLVYQGDQPTDSNLVLEGFACRQKILKDGRRQITAFHIAGDFCDLHSFPLKTMDDGVVALTPCKVALVSHETLRRIVAGYPHLTELFWFVTLVDAAIHREWMTSMGRRTAAGRMAHRFCELFLRLEAVGLTNGNSYELPITQAELGDALGLSLVHTNRTLQELVRWQGHLLEIIDFEGLKTLGDFDPAYLYLEPEARERHLMSQ